MRNLICEYEHYVVFEENGDTVFVDAEDGEEFYKLAREVLDQDDAIRWLDGYNSGWVAGRRSGVWSGKRMKETEIREALGIERELSVLRARIYGEIEALGRRIEQ